METLVRLLAKPLGFAGAAFALYGIVVLGMKLSDGARDATTLAAPVAMIVAGMVVAAYFTIYGY